MAVILFNAIVGSRAFNLHRVDSDHDTRGVWAKSVRDMLDPFTAVQVPSPHIVGDVYHHDLFHFLKLLERHDLNAWQALYSRVGVFGYEAQQELRWIAQEYILNPGRMVGQADDAAYATMIEAMRKGSGKIASIAMRNLLFAQNVAEGLEITAFSLGEFEMRIRDILDVWNEEQARNLFNEIREREIQLRDHTPGSSETCVNLLEAYYNRHVT